MRKVALITGSSRGIGRATITEFAKKGYNVVINYKNSEKEATELKAVWWLCEIVRFVNVPEWRSRRDLMYSINRTFFKNKRRKYKF